MKTWENLCPGCFKERNGSTICQHCGYDGTQKSGPLVLPYMTILHAQYLVGRVLGKPGGFGITYLAMDLNLEKLVAIKEYLPRDLATREVGQETVVPHSCEDAEIFGQGLEQFLNEARILAKFDHPHIAKVLNFFQEHGTAYMVMEYYKGQDLAEYVKSRGGKIAEKEALEIMMPVLDALKVLHGQGVLHRDIKPSNIYITEKGKPILLDFGAARKLLSEKSQSLSVIYTPGFAPLEQYTRRGHHGPWTDIYSCGAVLYYLVTGMVPPEPLDIIQGEELAGLSSVSGEYKTAVTRALEIDFNKRPVDINNFIELLDTKAETQEIQIISVEPVAELKDKPQLSVKAVINSQKKKISEMGWGQTAAVVLMVVVSIILMNTKDMFPMGLTMLLFSPIIIVSILMKSSKIPIIILFVVIIILMKSKTLFMGGVVLLLFSPFIIIGLMMINSKKKDSISS